MTDPAGNGKTVFAGVAMLVGIIASTLTGYSAMVAPLNTRIGGLEQNLKDSEGRANSQLDKSERGLKELADRAEGIVRQTVEDVDNKLRREAALIEEKSKIQFTEIQRQIELLRGVQVAEIEKRIDLLRQEILDLRAERQPSRSTR